MCAKKKERQKKRFTRTGNGYTEESLFNFSYSHFVSAVFLMQKASYHCIFSAGYLLHLCLELALKACALHVNDSFLQTHDLLELSVDVAFLNFDENDSEFIAELNKFYDLRYDIGALDSIGQGDERMCIEMLNKISKTMPEDLYTIFRKVFNDAFEKQKK